MADALGKKKKKILYIITCKKRFHYWQVLAKRKAAYCLKIPEVLSKPVRHWMVFMAEPWLKSTSYIISMLVSRQPADTSKAPHHPPYNALYPMKQLPLGYPDGVSFFPRITRRTATAMWCSTGSWKCHLCCVILLSSLSKPSRGGGHDSLKRCTF